MTNRGQRTNGILLFALIVLVPLAQGRAENFAAIEDETKKLHTLFDDEWQWTLRNLPEFATSIGDPRYDYRLTDLDAPAIEARRAHKRDLLSHIREIDRARLIGQDVLS